MSEDISKLPKWAQRRITKLEADLKHYHEQQARVIQGSDITGSRVLVEYTLHAVEVSDRAKMKFLFDDGTPLPNEIEVRLDGDCVKVYGSACLSVSPVATNVVEVQVGKRR